MGVALLTFQNFKQINKDPTYLCLFGTREFWRRSITLINNKYQRNVIQVDHFLLVRIGTWFSVLRIYYRLPSTEICWENITIVPHLVSWNNFLQQWFKWAFRTSGMHQASDQFHQQHHFLYSFFFQFSTVDKTLEMMSLRSFLNRNSVHPFL